MDTLKTQTAVLQTYDKLYWGCIRPLCIEFIQQLCRDLLFNNKSQLLNEFIKQYRKIRKHNTHRLSSKAKNIITIKLTKFLKGNIKKYKDLNYTISFNKLLNRFYFTYKDTNNCFFVLNMKQQTATGLTELWYNNTHYLILTNPGIEFYLNSLGLMHRSLLYIFKDTIYECDSIYMHERQHIAEDVLCVCTGRTRDNNNYKKILKGTSNFYFNKYVHHPVEIAANIQQLVYYLHTIRPTTTIDASRFLLFFLKYKEYKFACSFRRTELNKFKLLFAKRKAHDRRWYRLIFKLINIKYFRLYRRLILTDVKKCLDNLESIFNY